MEEKERSVVERLEDIENKLSSPPKTVYIDDIIGMSFSSYMEQSTIYGIEKDERQFKHSIKKKTAKTIVCLGILLVTILIHIIAFSINKSNEWMLIVADVLTVLYSLVVLIILGKQKCKQPMKSFWNVKNKEFYLVPEGNHKKISSETKNAFWFYVLLILKIISLLTSIAFPILYIFSNLQKVTSGVMFWLSAVFGYLTIVICVLIFKVSLFYYYHEYIFEANDSYVTYPGLEYVKKDK